MQRTSSPANRAKAAILGASGYTGAELIRLIAGHPHIEIGALTAERRAGEPMAAVYPHLGPLGLPDLTRIGDVDFGSHDLVFCCLPHGTTQEVVAALPGHLRVVDLSADFRLSDTGTYRQWYGRPHQAPKVQEGAVYGLTEIMRDTVRGAGLVANPGCYPTGAQLPLIPLIESGSIGTDRIIIDAKSGVTGAGRTLREDILFTEVQDGIHAYGLGGHRHIPEIEQGLSKAAAGPIRVTFTPHLMPINRGILSTIYVGLADGETAEGLRLRLADRYADEPFVHVLPSGAPATRHVRGSNHCMIGVAEDRNPGGAILVSAIDNLVKGASGQAVQNMNAMNGWPETCGLELGPVYP